jgi:serine/threonine protein kinase
MKHDIFSFHWIHVWYSTYNIGISTRHYLCSLIIGCVCKAKWLSKNRQVACKILEANQSSAQIERICESFLKELAAYSELSGPYILKMFGYAVERLPSGRIRFMIVMELMSRGSLANVLENEPGEISLRRKLTMARHIAGGMRRIHQHGMIHRDIRPDNILVTDNYTAKIGDMGIARVLNPLGVHTQLGCLPFMPPEFHSGIYDEKLDIFMFGITLNQLFTETIHNFHAHATPQITFKQQSPIFEDLIARCMNKDPKQRPTAIELEKTLELYEQAFTEIILKKHISYICLNTSDKNEVFINFYRKFQLTIKEFLLKKFPN